MLNAFRRHKKRRIISTFVMVALCIILLTSYGYKESFAEAGYSRSLLPKGEEVSGAVGVDDNANMLMPAQKTELIKVLQPL